MSVQWNGADLGSAKKRAHQAGADLLLAKADRDVPRESSELENSGKAEANADHGEAGYGSGSAGEYAIIQHERLDLNHPRGGRAKWLEVAVRTEQAAIMDAMADEIRLALS